MAEKKLKLKKGEIVGYSIAAFFGTVGLTFIIFGIIGDHYQGLDSDNWVSISENAWLTNWSGMGYRWWGLILLVFGMLLTVLILNVVASSGDRDEERANRRKQRQLMAEAAIEAEAVDAAPSAAAEPVAAEASGPIAASEPAAEPSAEEPAPSEPVAEAAEPSASEPASEPAAEAAPEKGE